MVPVALAPAPPDAQRVSSEIDLTPAAQFSLMRDEEQRRSEYAATLVRGLAHGLNNHLHAIGAHAQIIAKAATNPKMQASAQAIVSSCEGVQNILENLLACTTPRPKDTPLLSELNLGAALEEWRAMLTWMASERCDLQVLAPHAVWVRADPALVLRCLLEVLKNSVDAAADRKVRIRVSCGFTHLSSRDLESVRPLANARPGSYGFVAVEDEGEGIDPAVMPRVFDPFFSTRFLGRGLGLPLVLMHTKRMQGLVQMHSTPHVGTRTRLLFPELPQFDA